MMKSMKKLLLMAAIAVMVVSLAAPVAMAEEVQDHPKDPSGTEPVVGDHPEGSINNSSDITEKEKKSKEEDPAPQKPQVECIKAPCPDSSDSSSEGDSAPHEPQMECIKAPCPGSSDSSPEEDSAPHEPQMECIKAPCPGSNDTICLLPEGCDPSDEPTCLLLEGCDTHEKPYKDPGIRQCDLLPIECPDSPDSTHNPVSPSDGEASNTPDGGTIYDVCPYDDYYYDPEDEICWPKGTYLGSIFGEQPWPDSVGGHIGLLGDIPEDTLTGFGLGLELGLSHYLGDALIEFGEGGGPIGWAIQGVGYGFGFVGEAGGALTVGLGEAIGAVADTVGGVVDDIGDAFGSLF